MLVNAYLPSNYVTGDRQRLEVYRRIAGITTAAQRDDVEEELVDRFGDEPQCVANLVAIAYLKAICAKLGIERVKQENGIVQMFFSPAVTLDAQVFMSALQNLDPRLTLSNSRTVTLLLQDKTLGREDLLHVCVNVMERLSSRYFDRSSAKSTKD